MKCNSITTFKLALLVLSFIFFHSAKAVSAINFNANFEMSASAQTGGQNCICADHDISDTARYVLEQGKTFTEDTVITVTYEGSVNVSKSQRSNFNIFSNGESKLILKLISNKKVSSTDTGTIQQDIVVDTQSASVVNMSTRSTRYFDKSSFQFRLGDILTDFSLSELQSVQLLTLLVGYGNVVGYTNTNNSGNLSISGNLVSSIPESIIVLTHGWQPQEQVPGVVRNDCVSHEEPGSKLPELKNEIVDRLFHEISLGNVEVLDCRWPQAYTAGSEGAKIAGLLQKGLSKVGVDVFDNTLLMKAQVDTEVAGNIIASRIQRKIETYRAILNDKNYDPKIHFIGHSLGTLVNAYAIKKIFDDSNSNPNKRITIEQATILDSPSIDPDMYYKIMPVNSVQYVDNYYGEYINGATGSPISSTFPCDFGYNCTGLKSDVHNHEGIQNSFYRSIVGGLNPITNWITPVIDGWSPPIKWNPLEIENIAKQKVIFSNEGTYAYSEGYRHAIKLSDDSWKFEESTSGGYGLTYGIYDYTKNLQFLQFRYLLLDYISQIENDTNTKVVIYFHPNTGQDRFAIWEGSLADGSLKESDSILLPTDFISLGDTSPFSNSPYFEIHVVSRRIVGNVEIDVTPNVILSDFKVGKVVDYIPGDLNEDDLIDYTDFSIFYSAFGSCLGQSSYDNNIDYDADGCITFQDYQSWYELFSLYSSL